MFLILAAIFFHSGYSIQAKYDHCKSLEFKGKYCSLQESLNRLEE